MKVGDLVKWTGAPHGTTRHGWYATPGNSDDGMIGVIVQLSRTGHDTTSAKVVFSDGYEGWHDTQKLEVVNESR